MTAFTAYTILDGTSTPQTVQFFTTPGQTTSALSMPVVIAVDQSAIPVSQSGTWNVGLSAGSNAIGSITNTTFAATQSGTWSVGLAAGSNAIGSITNTGFQASGPVADGATATGNPLRVGGIYNSSPPTYTTGQIGTLQLDANGNLKVYVTNSSGSSNAAAGLTGAAVPTSASYTGWSNSGTLVGTSLTTPMPVGIGATYFVASANNSTAVQLAPGSSFTGVIESIFNQPCLSIQFTADQPCTIQLRQYIDIAGAKLSSNFVFPLAAGQPFSQAIAANGNYYNAVVTNNGPNTTTTLQFDTSYGTLPPVTQLGNAPSAINEVGGVATSALTGMPVNIQSVNGQNVVTNGQVGLPTSDLFLEAAQSNDQPIFVAVTGSPAGDFAGVNIIEQVMDDASGLAFNTKVLNPPKVDVNNALLSSDAPAPLQLSGAVGTNIVIDTTGYQSINITTQALAGTVSASNDQLTWSTLTGVPLVLGAYVTALTASSGFSFPCVARYLRITVTTAGQATAYLRSQPWNGTYTTSVPTSTASNNLAQVGGTAVVTGGLAGTLGVGGSSAAGASPTTNPVGDSGVDGSGLVRRLLTDTNGSVTVAGQALGGPTAAAGPTYYPQAPVVVQETAGTLQNMDGSVDALNKIVQYLAAIDRTLRELPLYLNTGTTNIDEFVTFRDDLTNFNN